MYYVTDNTDHLIIFKEGFLILLTFFSGILTKQYTYTEYTYFMALRATYVPQKRWEENPGCRPMPMAEDNKALQGFSCHGATKSWVLSPEKTCYLDVMKHQKFQKIRIA